ncbi:MAG: hypothetical protein AAF604_20405 [Acidobacteriota bacterium]
MRKAALCLALAMVFLWQAPPAPAATVMPGGSVALDSCNGNCLNLRPDELEARLCGVFAADTAEEEEHPAPTCEPIRTTLITSPSVEPQALPPAGLLLSLADSAWAAPGEGAVEVTPQAFCFTSQQAVATACGDWRFGGGLAPGRQPVSTLLALRSSNQGGSFTGALRLRLRLVFVEVGTGRRESWDETFTFFSSGPWADLVTTAVPRGGGFDSDCSGVVDSPLPPPAALQAGWVGVQPQPFWLSGDGQLCLVPRGEAPFLPPGTVSTAAPKPPKEELP